MERPRPRFPDPSVTAAYTHCLVCLEYTQRANERVPGHSLHNAALLCPSRNDVAAIDRALELAVLSNYSTPKWRQVAVEKLQSLRQRAGELGGTPFVVEEVQGEPQLYHEPVRKTMDESIIESRISLAEMKARFNEAWVASEVDELTHELDGLDIVNPRNKTYAQVEVSCRPDAVGLTATDIAGYFHFGCDLALRLTRDKRREVDIPRLQPGVLTEALFKRGNEWEEHLVQLLRSENLLLETSSNDNFLDVVKQDPRQIFFVTGYSMVPPSSLFRTRVRTLKPDFIRVTKTGSRISIAVIDAKVSRVLKVSHQIQIAMYAYCLRNVVEPYAQIEDTAYVWLCPTSGITSVASAKDFVNPDTYFSLKIVTPLLETLLNKHLPSVLNDSLEAVEWGVGTRCQGCEFESGCTSRAFATGDVSLVGGTKGKERSALKEIIRLFRTRNRTKMKPITFPDVTAGKWNDWWTEVRWDRLGPIDFGRSDLADLYAAIQSPDFNSVLQQMNPTALQQGYKLLCLDRSSVRNDSPILKAVLENSVEVLGRPCFMFPPSEDHAINFSVLHDPETDSVIAISILHCSENRVLFSKVLFGRDLSKQFIPIMASRIRFILSQSPVPSAQFYVFSTKERDLVFSILLDGFNETTTDDLQLCFAAMLDQTDVLLAPIVPPLLISKEKLIGSLGNKSKLDLQWYLRVLENAASTKAGTKESLQTEIKSIIKDGIDPVWMPRIAVISTAIRSTLALPVSRLTMTNTVALLNNTNNNVLSSDDMYTLWKTGELTSFEKAMFEWSSAIHEICNSIRTRISESFNLQKVLVNSLPPFSVSRLDICREPLLSRLLFQTQFEMVKEFQSVKEARFDKFEACEVEYQRPHEGFVQQFLIRSDTSLIQASMNRNTSDFKMYSWILADSLVDAAIKFNDLRFMNQVEYGLSFSEEEKRETLNSVAFAEINSLENDMAQIELRMPKGFALRGRKFFLYRRFVDFNTHKVVQGLINTEITALARLEREELRPLFLRLLGETSATSLRVSSANDDLQVEAQLFEKYQGGPLHLLESQRQAFQGVCKNVLSLIWGPPGNGKTHTLAVSALRLIEIAKIRGRTCRILMTAFTHAAISTFETKFTHLLSLSEYSSGDVTVVNLKQDPNNLIQQKHCVVLGTVWAIHKLLDKSPKLKGDFDVLVVDEGSQLLTSYASIAFQAVDSSLNLDQKRVLIAGDHLQLGPILKQPYPIPKATRPIYGSILSCLIHKNESLTYMLRENFRFVRELCEMVQPLYVDYGQAFAPYNSNQTMVKEAIGQWLESPNGDMEALMRASFESPLVTVQLPLESSQLPFEFHVHKEALMVSDMVLTFHSCAPNARIFVITPHRLQRTIIQNTLELHLQTAQSDLLRIDTVERMQGDQADIVIACYGFTGHRQMLENEIEFIFDIHRVNVALSRSKALCILVASKNLFQPSALVLKNDVTRSGLSHFKRFKDASAIVDWK